jgi:hypothetical protein
LDSAPSVHKCTAADLVMFWGWVASKGLMNENTTTARRIAVKEVLSTVEPDTWESLDVSVLDVDDVLDRFETLVASSRRFKPQSLATYRSRFRSAVQEYLEYQANPGGWRPLRRPRSTNNTVAVPGRGAKVEVRHSGPTRPVLESVVSDSEGWETYRFPIRPGVMATLNLPTDLKSSEVKRLSAFLYTLPMESVPTARASDAEERLVAEEER